MGLLHPVHPLDDSCSVIFNNTLYSFTPTAFQMLRLEKKAKWKELPMGVSVEGAACVSRLTSSNETLAAMYVVGGLSKSKEYQGLQRFIFATKTWEKITPSDPVTQNRVYHGATYLNASDSILIYSGTQNGKEALSSQTFTIKASEPYQVSAYQSIAPPAISPMILPWSNSKAIYVGGSKTNQKVMFFDPATSWVDSNFTLAQPISHSKISKSVIVEEDESNKALYTFDLSVSPNTINKTIISDPKRGSLQSSSLSLAQKSDNSSQETKILSTESLVYSEDSVNPRPARISYAASIDPSGLVVFSGGSDQETVCIYNIAGKKWEDTTKLFSIEESLQKDNEAGASSVLSTPNSADTPKSIEVTPQFPRKVLGAILGSILITVLFIIAVLIFFRSRRGKSKQSVSKDSNPTDDVDEKDGMDFMDRGDVSELIEKKSFSSKIERPGKTSVFHKMHQKDVGTDDPQQIYRNAISKPIPLELRTGESLPSYLEETRPAPVPIEKRAERRSSGWNRYWSGENGSATIGYDDFKSNPYMSDEYDNRLKSNRDSLTLGNSPDLYKVRPGSQGIGYNTENVALEVKIDGYMYEPSPYGNR
ncbi:hypothetical protein Golomagni_01453 [Golovinomyces magnicellulatus]|nr:hypothetical protein Golomagni_01453 [Golovinomyces magnicellulatus]